MAQSLRMRSWWALMPVRKGCWLTRDGMGGWGALMPVRKGCWLRREGMGGAAAPPPADSAETLVLALAFIVSTFLPCIKTSAQVGRCATRQTPVPAHAPPAPGRGRVGG